MPKTGTSSWLWINKHWAIIASLGAVALLALGAAGYWGYVTQYRLPDIDKQMEAIKKAEADRWVESDRRQAERFAKLETNLTSVKAVLITIMQKSGKQPTQSQLKELLSSVESTASTGMV